MKIARFETSNGARHAGIVNGGTIREINGGIFPGYDVTHKTHALAEVKLLPPCEPTKIVAIGLNYKDHAVEMKMSPPDEPLMFLKPSTAVIAHEEDVIYPDYMSSHVDYEGELAIVIGKEAKWISEDSFEDYVLGYTILNDISARDLQAKDGQFTRAKGFDTFAPVGPWIETELDPASLSVKTSVNGEIKQNSNTERMIFPVPRILAFITRVMTLLPGDIVTTGTPGGIGSIQKGDTMEVEIEGIGTLRNYVK